MYSPHHHTIFFPINASHAEILASRGAVKSHIPSTNFAFCRILHYISVNSLIQGKHSLATKLCPSQVSFENYQSNIVSFIFVKTCTAPRNPLMLHNHQSVFWEDSQGIVVLGGGGNCFSFGTHLNEFPVLIDLPLP